MGIIEFLQSKGIAMHAGSWVVKRDSKEYDIPALMEEYAAQYKKPQPTLELIKRKFSKLKRTRWFRLVVDTAMVVAAVVLITSKGGLAVTTIGIVILAIGVWKTLNDMDVI